MEFGGVELTFRWGSRSVPSLGSTAFAQSSGEIARDRVGLGFAASARLGTRGFMMGCARGFGQIPAFSRIFGSMGCNLNTGLDGIVFILK